jgi:hypothetical protein
MITGSEVMRWTSLGVNHDLGHPAHVGAQFGHLSERPSEYPTKVPDMGIRYLKGTNKGLNLSY